jgi:sugar lactone lactonase YvrE
MVYSPKGQLLRSFGAVMPGDTEEFKPVSVDVDAAGNILVADEGNHRIQVWSPDFELLCAFGTPGTDTPDQLRDPHCVTVAPNGDVLVSVGLTNLCLVF